MGHAEELFESPTERRSGADGVEPVRAEDAEAGQKRGPPGSGSPRTGFRRNRPDGPSKRVCR